jgi:WXG100 family type VII secretion target
MQPSDQPLKVEYRGVHNVSTAFLDAAQALKRMLDELDSEVSSTGMNTYWQGAAQDVYAEVKANWNTIVENMTANLGVMTQTLEEMARAYNTTDTTIALNWSEIR